MGSRGRGRTFDRVDIGLKPGRSIAEAERELQASLTAADGSPLAAARPDSSDRLQPRRLSPMIAGSSSGATTAEKMTDSALWSTHHSATMPPTTSTTVTTAAVR